MIGKILENLVARLRSMPQKIFNLRTAHNIVNPCLLDEDGLAADWFLEWEQE